MTDVWSGCAICKYDDTDSMPFGERCGESEVTAETSGGCATEEPDHGPPVETGDEPSDREFVRRVDEVHETVEVL